MAVNDTHAASVGGDDGELMEQFESGSTHAFEQLYDRYSVRAYRVARSVCRDDGRAEDAVQEAFLSIWRNRSAYRPARGTVASWLLCVVHYRAIDVARRNANHSSRRASEDMIHSRRIPGDLADRVIACEGAASLRARLRRLPERQREVIVLAYYGELTHAEIATQLALPAGTVKGRMRLGLQKLRAEIDCLTMSDAPSHVPGQTQAWTVAPPPGSPSGNSAEAPSSLQRAEQE